MLSITDNPKLAMLVLIVFFFLLGTFLEPVPALIIVVPIMGPLIAHLGYDPVHFGIITIMLLVVGSVTPPVGVLAMVACRIAGISYNTSLGMLSPFYRGMDGGDPAGRLCSGSGAVAAAIDAVAEDFRASPRRRGLP